MVACVSRATELYVVNLVSALRPERAGLAGDTEAVAAEETHARKPIGFGAPARGRREQFVDELRAVPGLIMANVWGSFRENPLANVSPLLSRIAVG